jgi:hypothetical protein
LYPLGFKNSGAFLITYSHVGQIVLTAVNLYGELRLNAIEIKDKLFNRMLTTKSVTAQLPASQAPP